MTIFRHCATGVHYNGKTLENKGSDDRYLGAAA